MEFIDVDTFPNYCKEPLSRELIQEAIRSYKSGAYRATITYTWLATVVNITNKIEKLATIGDTEALSITQALEKIRKNNDIGALLNYEKRIIKIACEKFELFDNITLIDLERLREDRNRCVHSIITSEDQLYCPTPEQAKNHLIVAIDRLLKEENVYGKSALEKLLESINSDVFPIKFKDVKTVLDRSYLAHSKISLKRNLLVVLIKEFLNKDLNYKEKTVRKNVIQYLISNHRQIVEDTLNNKLNDLVESFIENSNKVFNYIYLIDADDIFWEFLPEDKQLFVKQYVLNAPLSSVSELADMRTESMIFKEIINRVNSLSRKDILEIYSNFFIFPLCLCRRINYLYLHSTSFDEANTFSIVVVEALWGYDTELLIELIQGIPDNDQVYSSFTLSNVVNAIKISKRLPEEETISLLKINNLIKSLNPLAGDSEIPF